MTIKTSLSIAGAVALALGGASLAMAQYPATSATSTPPSTAMSPTMATSMNSPSMATTGQARGSGNMHNMNNMRNNSTHLSKSRIKQIQKALKGLGYYLQVDGNWGRGTIDDIKDLQFKNGLKVTGKPDANTLRALGLKGNHGSGMTRPGTSSTSRGMHNGMRGGMHNANMNRSNNNSMHNGRNTRTGTRNSNRNMRNMNTPSSATSMQSHRRTMRNGQRGMQNAQQGMHMRMSEMQIQHLQMKLDNKGYQVDQSGKWNNETRSAILRFQKQNGLKTTGQPDRKTRKALGITNTMWQSWAGSSSGTRSPSARTR